MTPFYTWRKLTDTGLALPDSFGPDDQTVNGSASGLFDTRFAAYESLVLFKTTHDHDAQYVMVEVHIF